MFDPDTVKGFPEFLPPQSQKFEAIKKSIENTFQLYGFIPIKTPTVEFDELMRPDNMGDEDEAVSDRFKFQDKGGRNLGLRYEFTFQLARIFKQHPHLKLPFRRYQIGSVFRDEPTASNRYREFTQADADIVGDDSLEADAECLALATHVLKDLKINSVIHVNNRKLLNAIIESLQTSYKREVMRELDKIDKLGEDMIKANLKKYLDSNQVLTLFKLMEKKLDFFVKNLFDGAEDLLKLQELGKKYGFDIQFDPFLVRGFSYYTGNIFEVKSPEMKATVAAGGRYNKAVGRYLHKEIPAVGISFGIERLLELAKITPPAPKAIVISLDRPREAIQITQKLRKEGIACTLSHDKPGKSLDYANAYAIPNAIFVGEHEVKKKKYKLKNMSSGDEKELGEKSLIAALKKEGPVKKKVHMEPYETVPDKSASDLLADS